MFASAMCLRVEPPWYRSALSVATTTAASTGKPPVRAAMSKNFSAPRSEPNPASVTTISESFRAIRVATRELVPWAMFAKGPPCTNAGVPSVVCTRLGWIASYRRTAIPL